MSDGVTFSNYLRDIVPKQYTYTNISDYIDRKGKLYDAKIGNAQNDLIDEVYNIDTCSVNALKYYWSKLYNVKPQYENINDGTVHILTDEELRVVVKLRAFASCWDGTTYTLNAFISKLFSDRGTVYVTDNGSMKYMIYTFFFSVPDWEKNLYENYDILPRCAGVQLEVRFIDFEVLGFYGSELYPLNQRPFFNYE